MTQILRQSTQIKVVIGPVVAVGDGFTPVTTLSLGSADEAEIIKSDAGSVTDISGATFAAITSADGYYNLTLTTSHTDTVGLLTVLINDDSLCLPVKATFQVIEEAIYDALYAASANAFTGAAGSTVARANIKQVNDDAFDAALAQFGVNVIQISGDATAANNLEAILDGTGGVTLVASAFTLTTPITANVTQISGDATAADNAESFFDGTGYAGTNNVIPTVTTATNVTTVNGLAAGVITATSIAADAITAAKIANGAIDAATFAADVDAEILSYLVDDATRIDASALNTASVTTVPAINTKLGTPSDLGNGATIAFNLSDIHTDTAAIDAIASKLSGLVMASEVIGSTGNSTTTVHLSTLTYGDDEINDHLLVIYDNSTGETHARWISDWVNATKLATVATLPFTPENAVDTYYLICVRQDVTGGSGLDAAGVRAAIGMSSANLDTQLAAIVADTNELQTDWVNGGRLDLLLDATLADTNELQTDWVNGGRLDLLLDATLADTNELQGDWANGGRLDLIVDAILDDTDLIDDGTSGLAKIATDVAAILVDTGTTLQAELDGIQADTEDIQSRLPAALGDNGNMKADLRDIAGDLVDTAVAQLGVNAVQGGGSAWAGAVRSAVGMAAANLDTQIGTLATAANLATLSGYVDTEVAAIKAKTDNLPAAPAAVGDIPTAIQNADALLNRSITNTQDTADVHSLTTVVLAMLESSMSGTTWTIRKTGGTTFTTKTLTVDAGADPITGVT